MRRAFGVFLLRYFGGVGSVEVLKPFVVSLCKFLLVFGFGVFDFLLRGNIIVGKFDVSVAHLNKVVDFSLKHGFVVDFFAHLALRIAKRQKVGEFLIVVFNIFDIAGACLFVLFGQLLRQLRVKVGIFAAVFLIKLQAALQGVDFDLQKFGLVLLRGNFRLCVTHLQGGGVVFGLKLQQFVVECHVFGFEFQFFAFVVGPFLFGNGKQCLLAVNQPFVGVEKVFFVLSVSCAAVFKRLFDFEFGFFGLLCQCVKLVVAVAAAAAFGWFGWHSWHGTRGGFVFLDKRHKVGFFGLQLAQRIGKGFNVLFGVFQVLCRIENARPVLLQCGVNFSVFAGSYSLVRQFVCLPLYFEFVALLFKVDFGLQAFAGNIGQHCFAGFHTGFLFQSLDICLYGGGVFVDYFALLADLRVVGWYNLLQFLNGCRAAFLASVFIVNSRL